MAITNNGVKNNLPDAQLPAGYTRPTITTFDDHQYERTLTLNVAKATVETASEVVTMENIIEDVTIGLTKQVDDILANDYVATETVTAYAVLEKLSHNYHKNTETGVNNMFKNVAFEYVCTVKLYVKVA